MGSCTFCAFVGGDKLRSLQCHHLGPRTQKMQFFKTSSIVGRCWLQRDSMTEFGGDTTMSNL